MRYPSVVVYRGPSALPGQLGKQVMGVLTFNGDNRKTGPMAQLWILSADHHPIEAARSGKDEAVCGDCQFRPANGGGCYVTLMHGPGVVYRTTQDKPVDMEAGRRALRELTRRTHAPALLRLGAYGDPAALPQAVVEALAADVLGAVTGYTHQWRHEKFRWLAKFCMASVENQRDRLLARAYGFRTFRTVAQARAAGQPGEMECLNVTRGIQCMDCGLCNGLMGHGKDVFIHVHGTSAAKAARKVE